MAEIQASGRGRIVQCQRNAGGVVVKKRFETPYRSPQAWLWELDDTMWSLAKRLPDYAPRQRKRKAVGEVVQAPFTDLEMR